MFREMQYVLAVYQEKGFSKAARRLYISQPSLSAMVRRAEERIGSPLFDRSTSPISLTQVGREYVRMALALMKAEEEFQQYVSDVNHCLTGTLSLGGTTLFTSFILPPLISAFSEKYPAVEIRLHETHTALLYQDLRDGELDLIVENSPLNPDLFVEKPLRSERLVLAVPRRAEPGSLAAYQLSAQEVAAGRHLDDSFPVAPLSALGEEPFLLLKEGNDTRRRADRLFEQEGMRPRVRLLLDQQITAYNLACAGMGASFISDTLVMHVPPAENLIFYKLDPALSERHVSFFCKKNGFLSSAVRAFIDVALTAESRHSPRAIPAQDA